MNFKNRFVGVVSAAVAYGALATQLFASSTIVYDALPSTTPDTSYPSQPFQAQQTFEFGDYIHLGGTERKLDKITVTMVTWAKFADYSSNPTYMNNPISWTHPITLNIYGSSLGNNGAPNNLLGTVTQNITIPWRPAPSEGCPDLKWMDSTGKCNNGYAFNATFDLKDLSITLPDDVIIGIAYNTQTYGLNPLGLNGPYNSLNVAVPENQPVSVGRDDSVSEVFWNTVTAAWYSDGGASGVGIFRKDTNWAPWGTVALRIETQANTPVAIEECKNDGWKLFSSFNFKNQGGCVSYIQANEKAGKK